MALVLVHVVKVPTAKVYDVMGVEYSDKTRAVGFWCALQDSDLSAEVTANTVVEVISDAVALSKKIEDAKKAAVTTAGGKTTPTTGGTTTPAAGTTQPAPPPPSDEDDEVEVSCQKSKKAKKKK